MSRKSSTWIGVLFCLLGKVIGVHILFRVLLREDDRPSFMLLFELNLLVLYSLGCSARRYVPDSVFRLGAVCSRVDLVRARLLPQAIKARAAADCLIDGIEIR